MFKSGSVQKYLLYTIGEVALISIGILIALQINNWNEDAKQTELEIKTLNEIRSELSITRGELNDDLSQHIGDMKHMIKLRDHLVEKPGFDPQLWLTFLIASQDHQAYPKASAFENLKSIGLDIIRTDSLRRQITDMYQMQLKRITDKGDYNPKYDIERALLPYLVKHLIVDLENFNEVKVGSTDLAMKFHNGKIKDYNALLNDEDLLRELHQQFNVRNDKIKLYEKTQKELDELVGMIDRELMSLE